MSQVDIIEPAALQACNEYEHTLKRVASGELPGTGKTLPLPHCVTLLAEELGEIAECVKYIEGMKHPRPLNAKIQLKFECIQLAAIALAMASR